MENFPNPSTRTDKLFVGVTSFKIWMIIFFLFKFGQELYNCWITIPLVIAIGTLGVYGVLSLIRIPPASQENVTAFFGANSRPSSSSQPELTQGGINNDSFCLTVVGHRGAGLDVPENTISAFRQCKARGCAAVEFDVSVSKDGVPVVFHDDNLIRMTGIDREVSDMTLEELKQIDVSVLHPSGEMYKGESIPTLEEAVTTCMSLGLKFFIDLKDNDSRTSNKMPGSKLSGCCGTVERKNEEITAFGAMNITIFVVLFLACVKDFIVIVYGESKAKSKSSTFDTIPLLLSMVFSIFGLIGGLLLICSPKVKSKGLLIGWIVFETIVTILFTVVGLYLLSSSVGGKNILCSSLAIVLSLPFLLWSIVAMIFASIREDEPEIQEEVVRIQIRKICPCAIIVQLMVDIFKRHPEMYKCAAISSFATKIVFMIRRKDPEIIGCMASRPCFHTYKKWNESWTNLEFRHSFIVYTWLAMLWDAFDDFAFRHLYWWLLGISGYLLNKDSITKEESYHWTNRGVRLYLATVNSPVEKLHVTQNVQLGYLTDTLQ